MNGAIAQLVAQQFSEQLRRITPLAPPQLKFE